MSDTGFALFDTPVGVCGIVWDAGGIIGVQLPEKDEAAARIRLPKRFAGAVEAEPPPAVATAIQRIVSLLSGEPDGLADIPLNYAGVSDFEQRVYEVTRQVSPGRISTYGAIAEQVGEPGAARAVGRAMGANPFPIIVPCHRVLAADGKIGGFSAHGGVETKAKILTIEKAKRDTAPETLFDDLPYSVKPTGKGSTGR